MSSENNYWTSAAHRAVGGSLGLCHLSVFEAPFSIDARDYPPQDPQQAREFAESLTGIEAVLEDLGPRSVQTALPSTVRADLDVVQVAAWGRMVGIADPAFASDGGAAPLRRAAGRLRERYPDARIVGRVTYYGSADDPERTVGRGPTEHTEDLVWLPDGAMFHASGRPGDEPFAVTGDPHAVVASLDLRAWMLDGIVDLNDMPSEVCWAALAGLALGRSDPWGWEQMQATAFRVRHSEEAVRHMEGLYFR